MRGLNLTPSSYEAPHEDAVEILSSCIELEVCARTFVFYLLQSSKLLSS